MRIIAVEGRVARDPHTRRIVDADGQDIDPADIHWARLLADGDVAEAPATDTTAVKTARRRQETAS